jgi:hypothetical protein
MKANPQGFWKPSYDGGGLLNLMGSLSQACGIEQPAYPALSMLDTSTWREARNVVLILADGVGGDFIERTSPQGFLRRHQQAMITSVCPTTTACAIPTLMSGLPPSGHGLTGWHVYLEEIDAITAVLPMTARGRYLPLGVPAIDPDTLFPYPKIYQRMPRESHVLTPVKLFDSVFSSSHASGAGRHPYYPQVNSWFPKWLSGNKKPGLLSALGTIARAPGPPRFIYAYWPDFDHTAHGSGVDSAAAVGKFLDFEARLEAFIDDMRGTDTLVVVTADHGFIDSPSDRQIHLDDHVALAKMLTRPVCGERRFAYCYLDHGTNADFEDYVSTVFSGRAEAWSREKLLDEQWLGPGPVSARLASRVGDYVLAMKEDWTLVDHEPDAKPIPMIGVHGGLSRQEMLVPLCVITTD